MSGGHFDYQESHLEYIAEQLERDIEFNDVEYSESNAVDDHYGFQHQPETLGYLKLMTQDLYRLRELLHVYDYAVSGDSSEQDFLEKAKLMYGNQKSGSC